MKISVLIKEPGKNPCPVKIENSLKNLQKIVGGYIEVVAFATNAAIICNEEGRLFGLPYCCTFAGYDFVGTVVIVGVNGDKFTDLCFNFKEWKQTFASLWE